MELIRSVEEMRRFSAALRESGSRIVLVPTMGALHDGHLGLIREAKRHGDDVVVSIFVNPTQFAPGEDFDRYPRDLDEDLAMLKKLGNVRAVFAPTVEEIYPDGDENPPITVKVSELNRSLCGRYRPNHFDGVATVVAKLFNIVQPRASIFGLKDAQQFVILKRMARDLFFDVDVVGVPTVREPDGLAMSSRNVYLTPTQRDEAVVISRAIAGAVLDIRKGEQQVSAIVERMLDTMAASEGARVQYAEVVDADSLQPLADVEPGQNILIGIAAFFW